MDTTETLGAVAHRGGLLVRRPELTVGVVRAVSTLSGLEIELLARRPLDRRSATERQRDLRAGLPSQPTTAPRRLLPTHDEGADLRVGWLDHAGRAHWEFATSYSSSPGDDYLGTSGPTHRAVFQLPPTFDQISLVLAWPETGFPETVITLPLPDQPTVERATTSIWQAPLDVHPVPEGLTHHTDRPHDSPSVETATNAAPPRLLHRRDHLAAVVLTRLTTTRSMLSMELLSIAKNEAATAINATAFPRPQPTAGELNNPTPAQLRATGPGASIAVLRGPEALWLRPGDSSSTGGDQTFTCRQEFTLNHPHDNQLDLVVAWPLAEVHDARVQIPLNPT